MKEVIVLELEPNQIHFKDARLGNNSFIWSKTSRYGIVYLVKLEEGSYAFVSLRDTSLKPYVKGTSVPDIIQKLKNKKAGKIYAGSFAEMNLAVSEEYPKLKAIEVEGTVVETEQEKVS